MNIKKIVVCGFGTAMVFLLTVFIVVPMPAMGYVNFGDSGILLFASIVNPLAAAFIGGVGSAMADIYLGYSQYALFTLIIKGLEGLFVAYLFHKLPYKYRFLSFGVGILVMIGGYYITDVILLSDFIAVLPAVQGNLIQGSVSLVLAAVAQVTFQKVASKHPALFKL
ncbi:putative membrane protein [Breznakia sp. PF5-3]|uniref:ECF transporter S component n=1 Tax=unclassified Breznakia TaxID=2623764 RepID=UPI002405B1EA|nr:MULTISPECIES: ECF transporter S component [unclassified Breznakia]MDL2276108.1 ECF transporter S component [Breznakia sp. OttesenSCG-928-G09]MDF9823868.1 putative membrane protein [Breznakia sp. PM6-1]MDF9834667.1 putative membrane protein [Breznakia sp. PF5-3]MDF9836898.1 putative membrane protein [Breznakia sp. PFB2-8]MDF9858915.1 putative membrane protein [Breznakia sp. PH5-24]